jgi:hypothetical protein
MNPHHRSLLPNRAIPACYAVAAVVAGLVLPRLETRLFPDLLSSWSASATLAIFSAIASGLDDRHRVRARVPDDAIQRDGYTTRNSTIRLSN